MVQVTGMKFVPNQIVELPHLEIPLSAHALCIKAFVGVVLFLVALETLNIYQVHCLRKSKILSRLSQKTPQTESCY